MKPESKTIKKTKNRLLNIVLLIVVYTSLHSSICFTQWITWQKTYGNSHINEGYSICQTPDGGYIAVARDRIGQEEKAWLLRLDQYGDTLWTKFIMNDLPVKIISTNDGNYLVLGTFTTIVKIDINGKLLWQSGPYDFDKTFNSVKQTIDGGYIICGRKDVGNISYPFLFNLNSVGDSLWEKVYTNNIFDGRFTDLTINNAGHFIMTGTMSDSAFISSKLFLLKTDNSGNLLWLNRIDSLRTHITTSLNVTPEQNIIVTGTRASVNKPFIAKFDSSGVISWYKVYNQANLRFGSLQSVAISDDNKYIFTGVWDTVGNLTYNVLLLKTDTNGNEIWHKSFGFNDADGGNEVKQTSDSGYVIIGLRGNYQNGDVYIIKTDPMGNSTVIGINPVTNNVPNLYNFYTISPNPVNPDFTLSFDIPYKSETSLILYDILGKEVSLLLSKELDRGLYNIRYNLNSLSSGVYFVRLVSHSKEGNYIKTQKLVLLK